MMTRKATAAQAIPRRNVPPPTQKAFLRAISSFSRKPCMTKMYTPMSAIKMGISSLVMAMSRAKNANIPYRRFSMK